MKDRQHRIAPAAALGMALLAAAVLVLALSAGPARAFGAWAHDGAAGCSCHSGVTMPTDATCTACHTDFRSYPDDTCWSCHAPGQDTSTLSTPSAACSQECHLWSAAFKDYRIEYTHGDDPHVGSTSAGCLDCHSTSVSVTDPGDSPHHSGEETGFTACGVCHGSYKQHAGSVECTRCHATAEAYHLYTADSAGSRTCRSCHAVKHDGRNVANGRCASCHKGTGSGPAARTQHSSGITKKYVCGTCHKQKLHARAVSKRIRSCRSCHTAKFHRAQPRVPKNTCLRCHRSASRHDNGFRCSLCHKGALHATRPNTR